MDNLPIARWDDLVENTPTHAAADGIDLVIVRRGDRANVSRGAARTGAPCSPTAGWRAPT